jgi:hypothetical protein
MAFLTIDEIANAFGYDDAGGFGCDQRRTIEFIQPFVEGAI